MKGNFENSQRSFDFGFYKIALLVIMAFLAIVDKSMASRGSCDAYWNRSAWRLHGIF